jgi:lipopolysaccharide export system permease protein
MVAFAHNHAGGLAGALAGFDVGKKRHMLTKSPPRGYAPLLGWYLTKRWLVCLLGTLMAFATLLYLLELVELLRKISGTATPPLLALSMAALKLPDILLQLLPFTMLIGTIVWLHRLNQRQELTAMKAAGLPSRRFLGGPALACLTVGLLGLTVVNPLAAMFTKTYERWYAETFPGSVRGVITSGGSAWLRQTDPESGRTYFLYGQNIQSDLQGVGTTLGPATIFIFQRDGSFATRLQAATATLQPGAWVLGDARLIDGRLPSSNGPRTVRLPTKLTAEQFRDSFTPPATLNVWELGRFVQVLAATGFPSARHAMAYAKLLALPALGMAMFALAIPFGLRFARHSTLARSIGLGVGLGFTFYLLGNFVAAYGLAGRLNPNLAAWLPVGIGLLSALALVIYLQED